MSVRDLEESIKKIMEKHDRALSSSTISMLTGAPMRDVVEKLNTMEKFGIVKNHKTMKVRFYKLKKE